MRITMVLPFRAMTGGMKVMVEYANRLAARGHEVVLVYPWYHTPPRGLAARLKGPLKGLVNAGARAVGTTEIRWADVAVPLRCVRRLDEAHLPDADILIATENQTIDPLSKVSSRKGAKVYLLQHYETWTRDPVLVDRTWQRSEWHKVATGSWLKRLAAERFGEEAELVVNGVDADFFHDGGHEWHDPPRVLALYHPLEWKGVGDLIDALLRLRDAGVGFRPVFFGTTSPGADLEALGDVEYHRFPTGVALRRLYWSADILVSPSWSEGCQLPPMEAMASGAAVVATRVGGVPDYTVPGETALVVEPRAPAELADAIGALVRDPGRRRAIARAGHRHIQRFSWARAVDALEAVLEARLEAQRAGAI